MIHIRTTCREKRAMGSGTRNCCGGLMFPHTNGLKTWPQYRTMASLPYNENRMVEVIFVHQPKLPKIGYQPIRDWHFKNDYWSAQEIVNIPLLLVLQFFGGSLLKVQMHGDAFHESCSCVSLTGPAFYRWVKMTASKFQVSCTLIALVRRN